MLTTSDLEKIYVDVLLGRPMSIKLKNPEDQAEAEKHYTQILKEVEEAKARGVTKFQI